MFAMVSNECAVLMAYLVLSAQEWNENVSVSSKGKQYLLFNFPDKKIF